MASNETYGWRAAAAFVALLVGIFSLTNYLTSDKIDSKIQQHSIQTESIHQRDLITIKEDIAGLKAGQQNVEKTTDRLEKQSQEILRRLDELRNR